MAGVHTIPPDTGFVDALATGILAECGGDPARLLDYTILLPTRRACRTLRESFLRATDGAATLLPAMRPLGDIDMDEFHFQDVPDGGAIDLPPVIASQRRRLLLTRLILQWGRAEDTVSIDQAAQLAVELERLLDQVQTERLSFDELRGLAPDRFAEHWQKVLDFLAIVTEHWPAVVQEQGGIDPAAHRNLLLETRAAQWAAQPPKGQVIAAGSTGSIPATADLLAVIAAMPNGRVVLPGLMREVDAQSWTVIRRDQTHPQHNLCRLLDRLGIAPEDVTDWQGASRSRPRNRLIAEVMRPADTTDAWRKLDRVPPGALDGVRRIDCSDSAEEAGVIALLMRHALETPQRTASLVTPDRDLARRVAAELRRWDIEIDDSAGLPLAATPPGSFLRLIGAMVSGGYAPAALLAVLKHPLASGGMATARFRQQARLLERLVLRGPRPAPGLAGLREALPTEDRSQHAALLGFLEQLASITKPLDDAFGDGERPLDSLLATHIGVAEALAASDEAPGPDRLWAGDAGDMLATFLVELRDAAGLLPPVPVAAYPALLDALMAGATVRPRYGRHPRLAILGLLEARLQHADLLILGGLNEGVWPPDPQPDPWLSRPMREDFGLPLPERRIGLTAHDFVQAFCAPDVVLTRADKSDGQPTVPSRWLTRLDAVLRGAGSEEAIAGMDAGSWRGLRDLLHQPIAPVTIAPAAPCPPLAARPRQLSVTQIEAWMRDPYAIFARHILGLKPLDPLDADPGAAERGNVIHAALDRFIRAYPDTLPADALDRLLAFGEESFGDVLARPTVRAFWWPRFRRIAEWFVAQESERRMDIRRIVTETDGRIEIAAAQGPFILTAKADRIDQLASGGYEIIDYKTGAVPTDADVDLGFAPQLPLEAVILQQGGFPGLTPEPVRRLAYWQIGGGDPAGQVKPLKKDAMERADAALAGLREMIDAFDSPDTPYAAVPRPDHAPRFNDYAHLARLREWRSE